MKKLFIIIFTLASVCNAQIDLTLGEVSNLNETTSENGIALYVEAIMPPHKTEQEDEYLCTSVNLPDKPMKLLSVEPLSEQSVVHHMLLFGMPTFVPLTLQNKHNDRSTEYHFHTHNAGCKIPAETASVWPCRMQPACSGGNDVVLYGWGKNAPAIHLPPNTGYSVGPGTGIRSVVLQVHYLNIRRDSDTSGVKLHLSPAPVTYSAGLIAYATGFVIPAKTPLYEVPNECCYSGFEPLHGFAYRVHTHALGKRVFLEHITPSKSIIPADGDPQKPQGFYPVEHEVVLYPGDRIKATCQFNSQNSNVPVAAGHTSSDEMCNLYLMVYGELPHFAWCVHDSTWIADEPAGGVPLSVTIQADPDWFIPEVFEHITLPSLSGKDGLIKMPLGQIGGIATEKKGAKSSLWAFHRGFRTWTAGSFDSENKFTKKEPIRWPAVLQLERDTGTVISSFGADMFYMPHMVSVDFDGNLLLVDTALHQVFKMSTDGSILLTLGQKLSPGFSWDRFCMPTHAIASRDGSIYVADGYCNSRIVKFNPHGAYEKEYHIHHSNNPTEPKPLPHSIALDECRKKIYVADREVGRVVALHLEPDGTATEEWNLKQEHGLPYAVAVGPYGQVLALTWDRGSTDVVKVVVLAAHGGDVAGAWALPGVKAPHDFEVVPAPLGVTKAGERMLSVVVAETAPTKSMLRKFVLHSDHSLAQEVERSEVAPGNTAADDSAHQQHHDGDSNGSVAAHGSLASFKPVDETSAKRAEEKFAAEKAAADKAIQEEQERIRKAEMEEVEKKRAEEEAVEEAVAAKAAWEALKKPTVEVQYDNDFLTVFQKTLSSPLGMISLIVMMVSGAMLVYHQIVDWRDRQRRPLQHVA